MHMLQEGMPDGMHVNSTARLSPPTTNITAKVEVGRVQKEKQSHTKRTEDYQSLVSNHAIAFFYHVP